MNGRLMSEEIEQPKRKRVTDSDSRAVQDVWDRTLERIPSHFGRLAYLAGLRSENSGRYQHHGLAQIYGANEADRVLRISHERVFAEWLAFGLEAQRRDLEDYFRDLDDDRETILRTWSELEPYRTVAPAAAGEAERELFAGDLEIILDLLRRESVS